MKNVWLLCLVALFVAGCSNLSGTSYERSEARSAQEVRLGTVVSVKQVDIEGTKSGVGAVGGAALGGVGGSSIFGGKKGEIAGGIAGAILGGLAGGALEEGVTRQKGLLITVRLDSGRVLAITQGGDELFSPGQRVQVLTGANGTSRVVSL